MLTHLESQWIEDRGIWRLFPRLTALGRFSPAEVLMLVKRNDSEEGTTLSELVDAFWWCMYGVLYSTEDERTNAPPHDDYFYGEEGFSRDVAVAVRSEWARMGTQTHRYGLARSGSNRKGKNKGKNSKSKTWSKKVKDYTDFVSAIAEQALNPDFPPIMRTPEKLKVSIDMMRCSQEELLGNNVDDVIEVRKEQVIAIGNFVDDVFVYRGYVNKIQAEGAEVLSPEQVDEWETCKLRLRQHCSDVSTHIPGFVKALAKTKSFMIEPLEF